MGSTKTKLRSKSDLEEYKRFLEAAKKAGASDDPKEFDRAFKRVAPTKWAKKRV